MNAPLLEVRDLAKHFPITSGFFGKQVGLIKAVDGISFEIQAGETLGLVGESGCGKTTTGRLILRLIERTAGELRFRLNGREIDLGALEGEALRDFRRHIQLIFQDPFSSLNPRITCKGLIAEPLRAHGHTGQEIDDRVRQLADNVRLDIGFLSRYPHAFSGGQRQRIGIARALALQPELIICDEPVTALDVSVQAQVLNLLMDLQEEHGLTYLFIAHDLSVVEHISHRVAVMYAGRIVELADKRAIFDRCHHPYTRVLMDAVPEPAPGGKKDRALPEGEVADPSNLPSGCAFHPRCRFCEDRCKSEVPELRDLGGGHLVACHFAETVPLDAK